MSKERGLIRQMIRGCGELPGVGEHPGTLYLILFVLMGVMAGANGGIAGCAVGAGIMALLVGPLYLMGAYSRAELSDRLSKREKP